VNCYIVNQSRFWTTFFFVVVLLIPWSTSAAQNNSDEHLATILILDNSGSMTTSDPTDLRYTAAQLFVALLDQGDAVGALRFSTNSSPITNGIETIENSEQQSQLVNKLAAVPPEGFTDIKAVFEQTQQMIRGFNQSGYKLAIIFLTDGRPEVPNQSSAYDQEALEAAVSLNVPILSIALTNTGQSPFLNQLASETGGQVIFAKEATDLLDIYLQILGELKDRTVIGSGSVSAPADIVLPLESTLMPYVYRASFVVSKPSTVSGTLISPDGQTISESSPGVDLTIQDRRFSVFTVSQLVGGDWHFNLNGSGDVQARVILYSRLRVRLVSPQNVFEAGQPLPLVVKLVEEQPGQAPINIIGEASFSALVTCPDGTQDSLDQFYDDRTHGDIAAGDGLFTRMYVNANQPGNYQVRIQGYKGSVPVTFQTIIQGISFPMPVLDEPSKQHYDIRNNPIPLQIHLSGAMVNELDKGGFVALVTTPGGITERLPLSYTNNSYVGEYSPKENGTYQVIFEPVDAAFQGLPYNHSINTSFNVRIVSSVTIENVQIGLSPSMGESIPKFELLQSQQGIPVIVKVASTSQQTENIFARLKDLDGFTLKEDSNLAVASQGETTLTLHIVADPNLKPQTYHGRLLLNSQAGIDLLGGEIPLNFEVFEPTITIIPVITSTVSSKSCRQWAPVQLTIYLTSTSIQSEQIGVHLADLPEASLSQESISVQSGISQIDLTILPQNGEFASGRYSGQLVIDGLRNGVGLNGQANIPIAFEVNSFLANCRKPLIISGVAVLFVAIITVVLIKKFTPPKPMITGTLIHWNEISHETEKSEYLTELNKSIIKIGNGAQNDIVISDDSLAEEHLEIQAIRRADNYIDLILHPIAPIRKGYREYTNDLPLEENIEYMMGDRKFKYIAE